MPAYIKLRRFQGTALLACRICFCIAIVARAIEVSFDHQSRFVNGSVLLLDIHQSNRNKCI